MGGCVLVCALVAAWQPVAAKKSKKDKQADAARLNCETCQSVAHLLVKGKKEEKNATMSYGEVVGMLFSDREALVCNVEKLQTYADFLGFKADKMAKKCKEIVPERFEYKSAQDLKAALVEGKPRSQVAQLLCVDSGKCEKLWTKEEEPWRNRGKKKVSE